MRVVPCATVLVACLWWPAATRAQSPLATAVAHYENAAFDEALAALSAIEDLAPRDQVEAAKYRVLCLLALDRPHEALATMQALVTAQPTFRVEADAAPRLRGLLDTARRQVLPGVIRTAYDLARADWSAKRTAAAAVGFAHVAELGGLLKEAGPLDRAMDDLLVVAEGFTKLVTSEMAAAEAAEAAEAARVAAEAEAARRAAEAAAAPPVVSVPDAATVSPPAAAPPPAPGAAPTVAQVFDAGNADVTPPVPLDTPIMWRRGTPRPPTGTRLGEIEVIVDERGRVIGAQMLSSVSAFYDAILVDSARGWRYRPATRAGQPVLYRRVMAIRAD